MSDSPMGFAIGETVGGYQFLAVLDHTVNGVVYKVRNLAKDRLEVLKCLPRADHQDPKRVDRFLREVAIHARLAHPNIAAFYTAADLGGRLAMTMEYFDDTSLEQRLEQGPLPLSEAIGYVLQTLAALACAHAAGVVHRYIAPANIVVAADGRVKLKDFQLAIGSNALRLTLPGTLIGWLHYLSPEQIQESPDLDGRSDLYSLGAVFYELATGQKPFEATSSFDILQAHLHETPRPPSERNPAVPAEIDRGILTALAKRPAERFQTAEEFRHALEQARVAFEPAAEPVRR